MPKYKQPTTLQDMCIRKLTATLRDVLRKWMEKLFLLAIGGLRASIRAVHDVTTECITVNEYLKSSPLHTLDDLSTAIVRHFLTETSPQYTWNRGLRLNSWLDEKIYSAVCTIMLKSLLLPSTTSYDTRNVSYGLQEKWIIQTLSTTRNLTHLLFDTKTETDNSALLASNIHHLTHLVTFQYKYQCTDKVVEQLALHCSELQNVDVSHSHAVTNVSVEHLMKLRNLRDLNVMFTSLAPEVYAMLISELPNIATINWKTPICNILCRISTTNIQTISCVKGKIINTKLLSLTCPNITTLELYIVGTDLSSLTALNGLVRLHLRCVGYAQSNVEVVLQGIGHRLQSLELYYVDDVCMADIITLCSCLERLVVYCCTFVSKNLYTVVKSDLPHFKSVVHLIIHCVLQNEAYNKHLGYYVNLKVFECNGVDILCDNFMIEAVANGAFTNIERFEVTGTRKSALSMSTAWLLVHYCEHLQVLGYLGTWSLVTEENISQLETILQMQNLDLKIQKCNPAHPSL